MPNRKLMYGLNPQYRGDLSKKHFRFIPMKLRPDALTYTGNPTSRNALCLQIYLKGKYYYSDALCAN